MITTNEYIFISKYGKHCSSVIDDACVKLLYFEFNELYETCAKLLKEIEANLQRLSEMSEGSSEYSPQELYLILKTEFDLQLTNKRNRYLNQKIAPSDK